ncbi:MAG: molybdopterin biosynthesis protein [Gaiellales bacterium]|nr:MAG: molybdopterin biosynthesis protein [Gaiellales bacterium]
MKARRNVYLKNISLREAGGRLFDALNEKGLLKPLEGDAMAVEDSLGRVTSAAVFASSSSPHYHCAAMDGYSLHFSSSVGASDKEPVRLTLGEDTEMVNTGDAMPDGHNAVIMVEDVDQVSAGMIEITAAVTPWQHVRTVGEDIVATELILPENQRIRPVDIAAMLASGLTSVPVRRQPHIAIIPTGSELVQPGNVAGRGQIIEFNSRLLSSMASGWGAIAKRHEVVPDDFGAVVAALSSAAVESDIVVINAGSSAGSEDYTVHAIAEIGEVLVHGVRIKPGKPVVLGIIDDTPVLGIPGYPVSAALTMDLFAKPLIYSLQGLPTPTRHRSRVHISRKITSSIGSEEFIRVKAGRVGEKLIAAPVGRGAGALMSLVRADGLLRIPEDSEGVRDGSEVEIELLKDLADVENTIVAIGSHDIALDLLASDLRRQHPELMLSSTHVGSLGGLMALKRGEAHLAGTHLMDEETGEYNLSFINRYLPDAKIRLINLAYREQGIMVRSGNPLGINSIEDIIARDAVFINRQKGSGTRILLDFKLKQKHIEPATMQGYEREEYSHMAVAAAVLDGAADAGLGILAAARALGLEFIPVATERYDLAIPGEFYRMPQIQALLEVMSGEGFREKLLSLGGYDTSRTGTLMN